MKSTNTEHGNVQKGSIPYRSCTPFGYFSLRRDISKGLAKPHRGFSLVETLVVLALFTVLSLVITNAIASFYRQHAYTIAQSYQVEHARGGVELLVRDLREMTFAENGAFPLVDMGTSSISFYSDIDRDASVELVEYELTGTTFHKYVYNATGTPPAYDTDTADEERTLSEYVQNGLTAVPIFTYYNEAGDEIPATASITEVRNIEVNVIVNIDPIRDPGEFMLTSGANLRNLKEL